MGIFQKAGEWLDRTPEHLKVLGTQVNNLASGAKVALGVRPLGKFTLDELLTVCSKNPAVCPIQSCDSCPILAMNLKENFFVVHDKNTVAAIPVVKKAKV